MGFFNIFKKDIKTVEHTDVVWKPGMTADELAAEKAAKTAEQPAPQKPETQPEPVAVTPQTDEDIPTVTETKEKPQNNTGGFFSRLVRGLSKTSDKLVGGMGAIFLGRKEIDDELLDELEELFITSDIGVKTATDIIESVRDEVSRNILKNPEELKAALKKKLEAILSIDNGLKVVDKKPYVILIVGVNGTGKTTSIAKLAKMFKDEGNSVALVAGDTFRAAAIDQLAEWAGRIGIPIIRQQEGSDAAAVIYDGIEHAKAKGYDVVICDTAGRLHTKTNLMEELKKVERVIKKSMPDAPHETLLVLDATSGQNAVQQADIFNKTTPLSGIVLTKLDGTAKGGVIVGIVDELGIPVKFIGFGEGMEDLRPFEAHTFIEALFTRTK